MTDLAVLARAARVEIGIDFIDRTALMHASFPPLERAAAFLI